MQLGVDDVTRGRRWTWMVQYIIQVHEAKCAIYNYSWRWNEKLEQVYGDDRVCMFRKQVCNLQVPRLDDNSRQAECVI